MLLLLLYLQLQLAPSDVLSALLAVGLATVELSSHHTIFTLNNMVACLVATEILALVGLRSFRTATLLLVGLLAYDVFWVFGSPKGECARQLGKWERGQLHPSKRQGRRGARTQDMCPRATACKLRHEDRSV